MRKNMTNTTWIPLCLFLATLLLLPGCSDRSTSDTELSAEECNDKMDNDDDGKTDCEDPGCQGFDFCQAVGDGGADMAADAGVDGTIEDDAGEDDAGEDGPLPDTQAPCECDDDLDCTDDVCTDAGACQFRPQVGWCVIDETCVEQDTVDPLNPCRICDPDTSADQWTITDDGVACDDGEPCTTNDQCVVGACEGSPYSCASDGIDCTEEACDGNGGCLYPVKDHWCFIDYFGCVEEGEKSMMYPGECSACIPSVSQTSWSEVTDGCMILDQCYLAGERNTTGCQVCDPSQSTTSWSAGTYDCKIGALCYMAGDKNSTGCLVCDPNTSTTDWSPGTYDCQIGTLCYVAGEMDTSGCQTCDPATSTTDWSPADYGCKIFGKCYAAGDHDDTGCGMCDPSLSTTDWSPMTDACEINEINEFGGMSINCYPDGAVHPEGCARCDVSVSTTSWTPLAGACFIDPMGPVPPPPPVPVPPKQVPPPGMRYCYYPGDKPWPGSCEVCDPTVSQTEWSPATQFDCQIMDLCLNNGDEHPYAGGCAICDSSFSSSEWLVLPGTCLVPDPYDPYGSYATCYQGGDPDWTGCQICDPNTSQTSLVPQSGKCMITSYPGSPPECFDDGSMHPYAGPCAMCDINANPSAWTVLSGCLIENMCWTAGDPDWTGCQACDPDVSSTAWTPIVDDKCLIAEGPDPNYKGCFDDGALHPYAGPCAKCDISVSTSSWTIVSGCLIEYQCWTEGQQDYTGCQACDPDVSQTEWTPIPGMCVIPTGGGAKPDPVECYTDGTTNPMAPCAECDVDVSTTSWTPKAGTCFVGGGCYNDGDIDASGCMVCDDQNPTSLGLVSGVTATEYSFDSGALDGVTLSPLMSDVGWQLSTTRAANGTHSLYYGNPANMNYDTPGMPNAGTVTLPDQALPSGTNAVLSFWLWMDVEAQEMFDSFKVELSSGMTSDVLWFKNEMTFPYMQSWQQVVVDLSSFAGQTVSISFTFNTEDYTLNDTEGVYLDGIQVISGCTAP